MLSWQLGIHAKDGGLCANSLMYALHEVIQKHPTPNAHRHDWWRSNGISARVVVRVTLNILSCEFSDAVPSSAKISSVWVQSGNQTLGEESELQSAVCTTLLPTVDGRHPTKTRGVPISGWCDMSALRQDAPAVLGLWCPGQRRRAGLCQRAALPARAEAW